MNKHSYFSKPYKYLFVSFLFLFQRDILNQDSWEQGRNCEKEENPTLKLRISEQPDPPLLELINYFARSILCRLNYSFWKAGPPHSLAANSISLDSEWSNGSNPLNLSVYQGETDLDCSLNLSALISSPFRKATCGHRSLEPEILVREFPNSLCFQLCFGDSET